MANMVDLRPFIAVCWSVLYLLLEGINVNLWGLALCFTKLWDLLCLVTNESLYVGGWLDLVVSNVSDYGERIEIWLWFLNGELFTNVVDWSVDLVLSDTLLVDDCDLAKLIFCVFLNVIKFTNNGTITVWVTIDPKRNYVLILVWDTGLGIPAGIFTKSF